MSENIKIFIGKKAKDIYRARTDIQELINEYQQNLIAIDTNKHIINLLTYENAVDEINEQNLDIIINVLTANNQVVHDEIYRLIVKIYNIYYDSLEGEPDDYYEGENANTKKFIYYKENNEYYFSDDIIVEYINKLNIGEDVSEDNIIDFVKDRMNTENTLDDLLKTYDDVYSIINEIKKLYNVYFENGDEETSKDTIEFGDKQTILEFLNHTDEETGERYFSDDIVEYYENKLSTITEPTVDTKERFLKNCIKDKLTKENLIDTNAAYELENILSKYDNYENIKNDIINLVDLICKRYYIYQNNTPVKITDEQNKINKLIETNKLIEDQIGTLRDELFINTGIYIETGEYTKTIENAISETKKVYIQIYNKFDELVNKYPEIFEGINLIEYTGDEPESGE